MPTLISFTSSRSGGRQRIRGLGRWAAQMIGYRHGCGAERINVSGLQHAEQRRSRGHGLLGFLLRNNFQLLERCDGPYYNSALSYIPEMTWNDSCAGQVGALYFGYSATYGPTVSATARTASTCWML